MEEAIIKGYRDFLIDALRTLTNCERELFTNALNILMSGELKNVDEVFEIGDSYTFEFNHLDATNDTNVKRLVDVIELLRTTIESIKNLNAITNIEWVDE